MRKYRCVGVFVCGRGLQLEADIVKVKLDTSNWPLPSAQTTEVGAVCVSVSLSVCVCEHEASSNAG